VKGVVDCEDLTLNISRENYQDTMKMGKLRSIITKRILRLLEDEARKNEAEYLEWYKEFQYFLKEGVATDSENSQALLRLCRYDSNISDQLTSLEEYITKLPKDQNKIYYILGTSREQIQHSPYLEPLEGSNIPVLYLYIPTDEILFRSMGSYKEYKFISVETDSEEVAK